MSSAMRFVVKRARRGLLRRRQWVATIVADNGRNLFTSETYNNHDDAWDACVLVANHAVHSTIYDHKVGSA